MTFEMNVPWHDSDFALARRNDAGTVRADQPSLLPFQKGACTNHVERRYALGDTNDQFDSCCSRLHDCVRRERWWDENNRGVRARFATSFFYRVENINIAVLCPALAWRNATNDVRAV